MPKQSEGNNHTSKINIFTVSHTIYFLLGVRKWIFIAPLLKIRFSVPGERVETLKAGLKIAVSTRSTITSNQILKRAAMKNNMHYSKQITIGSTSVNAVLDSLGQQTSHSLQSLCFIPCLK